MRFVDVSEKIAGIIGSNAIILMIQANPFQSFYKFSELNSETPSTQDRIVCNACSR